MIIELNFHWYICLFTLKLSTWVPSPKQNSPVMSISLYAAPLSFPYQPSEVDFICTLCHFFLFILSILSYMPYIYSMVFLLYKVVINIHLHAFFLWRINFYLSILVTSFAISVINQIPYVSGLLWVIFSAPLVFYLLNTYA